MHIRYKVLFAGDIGARRRIWMLSTTKLDSTASAEVPGAEVSFDNSNCGGLIVFTSVGTGLVAVVARATAKADV